VRYLMDGPHWRIVGVQGFAAFFRAVRLLGPNTLVGLASGAWPGELRESLSGMSASLRAAVLERLPQEFHRALFIPVGDCEMETLAELAERHAEPEIATHIGVFTEAGRLLEWFDAPTDPIVVSPSLGGGAVSRFADELRARNEWVAGGV